MGINTREADLLKEISAELIRGRQWFLLRGGLHCLNCLLPGNDLVSTPKTKERAEGHQEGQMESLNRVL